jgi:multidrug efflux pump subunit AcrA (membrane-fusion protein)
MPVSQPDPIAPSSEAASQTSGLLADLAQILQTSLPPETFHVEFLRRVVDAVGARAGAVWSRRAQGDFRLEAQINLEVVGMDQAPGGLSRHAETLRAAASAGRPVWLPPRQAGTARGGPVNPTAHGLFLAPVLLNQQTVGFVEVWTEGERDVRSARALARTLGEAAGFVAAYLHQGQWDRLQQEQQLWAQVDTFARQVHGSLDPQEVAHRVANGARSLLGCDQVSVAIRRGRKTEVAAVSGAPTVDPRGPLPRAMTALFARVLAWGERLVYAGQRDPGLPPNVLQALDDYLAQSNSRFVVVVPLRDERERAEERPRSALLVESFGAEFAREEIESRLERVIPHAATALYSAAEHGQAPLRGLSSLLSGMRNGVRGRRGASSAVALGLALALVAMLTFVSIPLRLDSRGELLPSDRQIVYSRLSGRIIEVKTRHGETVVRGQELLLMEDPELQLEVEQLGLKVSAAEQRIALLNQQIGKETGSEERNALLREKSSQEYEMRRAAAERDILLQGARDPRRAPVVSPLTGKVVTFDAREELVGKTVKPGDPLLRVARTEGPWEVELFIPEGHVGAVREGLDRSPAGELELDLLLASHPHRTFKGRLQRTGLGGETTVKDNVVVLPARVRVTDPDLIGRLEGMPVGVEVRAKIHCGQRPIGQVWFFGLWEFFHEHVLF